MSVTLGVLDWGIGGIDFHARLRARHPELATIYWSDSGSLPYGSSGARPSRRGWARWPRRCASAGRLTS
ncbi:hypothetical protein [Nannocystis sp.]|uniref:hypothetical protein n=1 Tax=Nannocystis sp. TaxID=1962667 RepID=UPI0025CFD17B|nr:hypothetical protein [Nannocystis sp.]